ncbi:bacterial Ig-like domain-containing protein [Caproicibacter sp.]|uniref:bacterial Ig-like domain-containing protein n=1 Tax=Caproicibacter sp. TaxID=2814884 RepID=UPI0039890B95
MSRNSISQKALSLLLSFALIFSHLSLSTMGAYAADAKSIVGFEELAPEVAEQNAALGTPEANLSLPKTLRAKIRTASDSGTSAPGSQTLVSSEPEPEDTQSGAEKPSVDSEDSSKAESDSEPGGQTLASSEPERDTQSGAEKSSVDSEFSSSAESETEPEKKPDEPVVSEPDWEDITVTWAPSPDYDGNTAGKYRFTPELPEGCVLLDGVTVPEIIVTVGEGAAARLALGSSDSTTLYLDPGPVTIGDGTVTGFNYEGEKVTTPDPNGNYKIKQSLSEPTGWNILITGGTHEITLDGLNINNLTDRSAICVESGATVTLKLSGDNVIRTPGDRIVVAGVEVQSGATLIIEDAGGASLTADGGQMGGAGIGGQQCFPCGTVVINSGTVTATGYGGAGIGGGDAGGAGGIVTINGGIVTATSHGGGAGIGGGGTAAGGTVTINGGTVTATGDLTGEGWGGAGIGGGGKGAGGTVTINGGSVKATSTGGGEAIGKGKGGSDSGTLTNSGGSKVCLTTVALPSKDAETVEALSLTQGGSKVSYGITDMKPDEDGKLYLYLPASDDTIASVTARFANGHEAEYKNYYGSVTGAGPNVLKMDPVLSVNSSYSCGDTISPTVSGSSSGVTFSYSGKSGSETTYGPSSTPPTNCGDYTVSATPDATDSYYSKTLTGDFSITQKDIGTASIANITGCQYTGNPVEPDLTVTVGGTALTKGTDYTVSYVSNTDPGTATATVTGINNYTGSLSKTFTIGKADPSVSLSADPASGAKTGDTATLTASVTGVAGHPPTGTVKFYDGGKELGTGTLSSGAASYKWSGVGAGDHALKASYLGDNYYNTADGSIGDYPIAKRTPTLGTAPAATRVPYGSALSASALTGGKMVGANGTAVSGTFQWNSPDTVVKSDGSYEATFTPTDTGNYNTATVTVPVTVTYADPTISVEGNLTDQNQWAAYIPLTVTTITYDANASARVTAAFKANGQADFGAPQSLMPGGTFTAIQNGTYRFTVTDGQNQTAHWDVTVTQIDNTLPNTPAVTEAGKYTASNWYKESQTVSASFTATPGSPEHLQYSLDGGKTWTDGTSATVSAEGTTSVSFRVTDELGRTGTQASAAVNIDLTAPTNLAIAYRTNTVKNILNFLTFRKFFNDTVDGAVSAQDAGSGVGMYQYEIVPDGGSLDQNKWVTGDTFSIQPDFKGTVYARAQDKVGNVCEAVSDSIVTDQTKPSITASYAYSGQKIYDSGAKIGVVVTDACAGVNQITYQIGAGTVQTTDVAAGGTAPNGKYSFSIGGLPYGDYNVVIGATDNSGNGAGAVTVPVSMASVTGVAVTGAPANATQGSTYRLGATVSGQNSPSQAANWSLSGNQSTNTKIDQNGILTVGTDETAASLTVRAASAAVPSVSGSVTLPVKARVLTGVSMKTLPSKTRYYKGEALDVTGAVITAAYDNGTSEDIPVTLAMVSGFDSSKTGTQNVTVTYSGLTATFPVTLEQRPSSGGSSAPSLPSSLTDATTHITVDLSGATFPSWVTGVSLSATPETASGVPTGTTGGAADPQGAAACSLAVSDQALSVIGTPLLLNIRLLDRSGNPVSFTGSVTVRIPLPAGLRGTPRVFRYESDGTLTDMNAAVENGFLVFQTSHFSYYVIAGTGDSITLDTKDYSMPVGGKYQIGVKLTGTKAAAVKFHSTNDKVATVAKLKNGNYQVTGNGPSTAYIMFDVYDNKNHLLTHASVRVDVKTGIRPRGDSTRQIGVF